MVDTPPRAALRKAVLPSTIMFAGAAQGAIESLDEVVACAHEADCPHISELAVRPPVRVRRFKSRDSRRIGAPIGTR